MMENWDMHMRDSTKIHTSSGEKKDIWAHSPSVFYVRQASMVVDHINKFKLNQSFRDISQQTHHL